MGKISYLLKTISKQTTPSACPSCGQENNLVVDSKVLGLTTLRLCSNCFLQFRHPTDSKNESYSFYQNSYKQSGLTTDLPTKEQLSHLLETKFSSSEKDFSAFFPLLHAISDLMGRKLKILDFGANWGYACHQFKQLDFVKECIGYELSEPRKQFGIKNLNIDYINEFNELSDEASLFDVIFSSHVIEHMDNPALLKKVADLVLVKEGFIVLTCPNGSNSARYANKDWSKLWGEVHPNFISDQYLCNLFNNFSGRIMNEDLVASPSDAINKCTGQISSDLPTSPNLFLMARKTSDIIK